MKIQELRVGNYIYREGRKTKVYSIEPNNWFNGESDKLKPIPLTEEWLLKFGFKEGAHIAEGCHEWTLQNNRKFRLQVLGSLICVSDTCELLEEIELKYVHQLQNLYYALTGQELEIHELAK